MRYNKSMNQKGFSLVELLVYIAIFAGSAAFLISIFVVFTRIHVRQGSLNEINSQMSFVNDTIGQLVRASSQVDMESGTATSTLTLRMASSALDPTLVYLEGDTIYLKEGATAPLTLTTAPLAVDGFSVTKYEGDGGYAFVRFDVAVHYAAQGEGGTFYRTLQSAVSRASAATFDSSVLPNTTGSYDIGNATKQWQNGYFSGGIGIGTSPVAAAGLKTTKDISFSNSSAGAIFTSPGGTCYRLTIGNGGVLATSSVACP